jgi:hypothetical protein
MHLSVNPQPNSLPKRFPVGTTYVVEGRGGEDGHLRVFSRYVVLPGGRRINITADFGGPAGLPARRPRSRSQKRPEPRRAGPKKFLIGRGTTRQHGR